MRILQAVEGTWICTGGYGWFRGEWVKKGQKQKTDPVSKTSFFSQNFLDWTEPIYSVLDQDSRQLLKDSFSKKEDKFSFLRATSYLLNGIL